MKHHATKAFWKRYNQLPLNVQRLARKQYGLLKQNPQHPSLHFKPVAKLWSARINDDYRALAIKYDDAYVWFYIGVHAEYDKIIAQR